MTTDPALIIEQPVKGVVVLTLNRPAALNAIDMALARDLFDAIETIEQDQAIRCLVLTGAGGRAFCSGFDIHELGTLDRAAMQQAFAFRDPLMLRLVEARFPVIAAIEGLAYGAGALLAAAADLRIACASARFKVTAAAYDGANATWSLPALVGAARAKDILMTGRTVNAAKGAAVGLYNQVVEPGAAPGAAIDLAEVIAAQPATAIAGIKHLVNASQATTPTQGWHAEHAFMQKALERDGQAGDAVFSEFLGRKTPRDS